MPSYVFLYKYMKLGINFACIFLHMSRFSYFRKHKMRGLGMNRGIHFMASLVGIVFFLGLFTGLNAQYCQAPWERQRHIPIRSRKA